MSRLILLLLGIIITNHRIRYAIRILFLLLLGVVITNHVAAATAVVHFCRCSGIGIIIFDEFPDVLTLLGSAIIVGTGLFTIYRERLYRER